MIPIAELTTIQQYVVKLLRDPRFTMRKSTTISRKLEKKIEAMNLERCSIIDECQNQALVLDCSRPWMKDIKQLIDIGIVKVGYSDRVSYLALASRVRQ